MISKVIAYTKAGDDDWVEAAGTADWSAVTEIVTAGLKKKKKTLVISLIVFAKTVETESTFLFLLPRRCVN